ncbi:Pkinase-domain-containing protein [Eremomyces bilateralis CBS 781.70]|uniref:non-specific serine/threonine protein kinase n=1 Tax=Eremomyces bilateralis CBS 781.70 TaxID=1392243 RepID=A0A6G1G2Q8_9PEZI|nr:Pkinase-domain-containing protein [Eremomyces bilateralis CBS 781.70]KAF1812272.1 Pkinase-domain-containing protein [Eremomyces bilateralis CBS 781.70]
MMNGDISLSQTLGGLRIANPDEDASHSPSPPPSALPSNIAESLQPPPPSSHSSSSTVTDAKPAPQLEQLPSQAIHSGSLDFDPSTYSTSTAESSRAEYIPPRDHRQSMPPMQQSSQPFPQPSSYASQSSSKRPISAMYSHPNPSSSSSTSNRSAYRYRDDGFVPVTPSSASNSGRGTSQMPGSVPSRESSRTDRTYRHSQQLTPGNGPLPPRRNSKRGPQSGVPGSIPYTSSSYVEGGPLASSDEWKEKGAAVRVRTETDANGRPISKVLKKGVKDFNFGRTLGEGSYSTVLAATDRQTLREYAIKVLDKRHIIKEKKVKYVNIEKDTLNRLTEHPGIVRLYYTFQDERSLYFVLDLASNGELLGVLKKLGSFDEECTRFYGAQILDSIAYMHSKGVIHRDLKPENVLLDTQMHVKITDFGTAKILDTRPQQNGSGSFAGDPLDGAEVDRAMSFVGTAEYVSPELLTDKNACKASDLWAFGCIIYQLLAGRPPFKAANEYQTFQKIVGLDYQFPREFPVVARDLVERLLVLDPAKRLPIEHIKNHQFFEGVTWGTGLWKQRAPRIKAYTPITEPIRLNGPTSAPISTTQRQQQARLITELPPPSQLDIEWSPVLTRANERILKLGNLVVTISPFVPPGGEPSEPPKKFSRFFGGSTTKRRQRLVMITSTARIVMAAAGGDEKKAKLEINLLGPGTTWRSYQDPKGLTCWAIDTRDKHFAFEDPKLHPSDPTSSIYATQEWLDTLSRAKDLALSHHASYSASYEDSTIDLSSTISSPTSTLGGGGANASGNVTGHGGELDGVNIPSSRDHVEMEREGKERRGMKRFSRRHSKNGLAAVF